MKLILSICLLISGFLQLPAQTTKSKFAIAIHGGAGVISKSMPDSVIRQYYSGLEAALKMGKEMLEKGEPALNVVEAVVRNLEDNPLFNAGKGAVFTADGTHELDAAIMDGKTLSCGAVAGVKTVRNPISLARLVMDKTSHVLLAGTGADNFAKEMNVELVTPDYYFTKYRYDQLLKAKEDEKLKKGPKSEYKKGTVGCVVLDVYGNLAAATSTGGMTNKRNGRIGDAPIIGAGTYANNSTCAVSCTGTGEQFIRYNVAHDISAMMEYKNWPLQKSAEKVIFEKLNKDDGGLIAVDKDGNISLVYNSLGMFRGMADSNGKFEIKIWE